MQRRILEMNIIKETVLNSLKKQSVIINTARHYAFKSDLKIKWVRPEKIASHKAAKSGDLTSMPKIDKSQYILEFQNSKELESADELVKRMFTVEFAPRKQSSRLFWTDLKHKVRRHHYDVESIEVKIARWTGVIRAWQDAMEMHPRNVKLKQKLNELIDKRKKNLKYLRTWDYKRFEWLLETLDIVYKPAPSEFRWVARRESLVKLTDKYCEELRQKKLEAYKEQLESEQPAFLEEKLRALKFIQDEQKECGVEVTVTDEEIDNVAKQLKKLLAQKQVQETE